MPSTTADLTLVALARRACRDGTLASLRQEARLSLRDLALAVGVNASTAMRWEQGSLPRRRHALALGGVLAELSEVNRAVAELSGRVRTPSDLRVSRFYTDR